MNISYNWLKNYININESPEQISAALTSIGLETGGIEEVQTIKGGLEGLVIGEVLTCSDHENSDHLHVTTVNIGDAEALQIVCGASNVAAGQKVVVATIGTTLYSGDESFKIKKGKIRGVESNGMICAEDEIGIGTDHAGIIVLPSDAVPGTPAKEYYGIESDYVLEVDITPNRVDATSHYGVARDLAAYYALKDQTIQLKKPAIDSFKVDDHALEIPVIVEDPAFCPRYSALTITGVEVGESPKWLRNALLTIGLRPINNVVDITNFVLHEMGQPLHAFDADKIAGNKVIVKTLPEGSKFTTLDQIERKLNAADLMICNESGPMCIGGVFGGLHSGVTESTKNVFLESAYFNPVSIRKTAKRHGLNTDASFRYERGCDPSNTIYILKRCAMLIQEVAGGKISSEIVDIYPDEIKPAQLDMHIDKVYSLIGKNIGESAIETILQALEIKVLDKTEGLYKLEIPHYRVDVLRDVDVIEDILRIYGYNNIETGENLHSTLSYSNRPDSYKLQNLVSNQLSSIGYNEIMNNSLTKSSYYTDLTSMPADNCVKLVNPLSNDLNVMRQTLLFGGLESISHNVNRRNADLNLYEFGNCYRYDASKKSQETATAPYSESMHLGIWISGNKQEQSWTAPVQSQTFFTLKSHIQNIFTRMGIPNFSVENYSDDVWSEALKYVTRGGKTLAIAGELRSKLAGKMDIEQKVYYADMYWESMLKELKKHKIQFTDIAKFPEVKRDLALLLDKSVPFSELERIAFETERKLLKKVSLFDVYEGKNLEAGKKSYAVSFILLDENKTLNDKQIDTIMKKLQQAYESQLNARLR